MAGVNKAIILGHLGNDPDVRTMPNGDKQATLSIATSENWTDKNTGEKRTQTEWHRIVLWRRQAEIAEQYLRKGSKAYIEGKIKTRKWQDQHGQDRYVTEIQGETLQLLDSKSDNVQQHASAGNTKNPSKQTAYQQNILTDEERADFDDDIPF